MSKTKIEWVKNQDGTQGYTLNPIKGLCPMACPYCYARRMYKRFKWPQRLEFQYAHFRKELESVKKPSKIFIGSTMELFGDWIQPHWLRLIFEVVDKYPQHTFLFLTKQPQNLPEKFPDNCWVGLSATDSVAYSIAIKYLAHISAKVRYLSIEPMQSRIFTNFWELDRRIVNWLIIGAQTPYSPKTAPKIEWVQEIVEAADKAGIPVFLKDNLKPLLKKPEGWTPALFVNAREPDGSKEYLRQEFPLSE